MKFGIYSSIANPPRGEDLPRCVDEVIEEAQLAEQAGFDSCFFGEHHQDKDGFLPSPLIVCTAVAAATTTLRVGTSVILLPLHHPVRLAEDVVTLDIISKGRVTVGVGLGYQDADFRAFGVKMSDRVQLFEEKVQILKECWSGQEFSYSGKHHQIENLTVRPDTVQQPHPPIWIGASAPVRSINTKPRLKLPARRRHRSSCGTPGWRVPGRKQRKSMGPRSWLPTNTIGRKDCPNSCVSRKNRN